MCNTGIAFLKKKEKKSLHKGTPTTFLESYSPADSNTPEPANQGFQGYLKNTGRSVGDGLELKSAGFQSCVRNCPQYPYSLFPTLLH